MNRDEKATLYAVAAYVGCDHGLSWSVGQRRLVLPLDGQGTIGIRGTDITVLYDGTFRAFDLLDPDSLDKIKSHVELCREKAKGAEANDDRVCRRSVGRSVTTDGRSAFVAASVDHDAD
jgi:hypothetical protein